LCGCMFWCVSSLWNIQHGFQQALWSRRSVSVLSLGLAIDIDSLRCLSEPLRCLCRVLCTVGQSVRTVWCHDRCAHPARPRYGPFPRLWLHQLHAQGLRRSRHCRAERESQPGRGTLDRAHVDASRCTAGLTVYLYHISTGQAQSGSAICGPVSSERGLEAVRGHAGPIDRRVTNPRDLRALRRHQGGKPTC